MATVTLPYTFVAGATALASEVNGNFNAIVTEVNGNLSAANLANGAVTENKLDDLSVATGKIQAGAVTDAKVATGIAATKIGGGLVDNTEFGYLNGVTSAIQTQLNAKQATITGAATTIDDTDLTASRALVSGATGKVEVSAVTSTELGYLDGVTSGIQAQLNALADPSTLSGSSLRIPGANVQVEWGTSTYTNTGTEDPVKAVTFGQTFAAAPTVIVGPGIGSSIADDERVSYALYAYNESTTGFTWQFRKGGTAGLDAGDVTEVHWVALGTYTP